MGYDPWLLPSNMLLKTGIRLRSLQRKPSNYRSQLDKIGFSYDWMPPGQNCDPNLQMTPMIFLQLFDSWYNRSITKPKILYAISFFAENGVIIMPSMDKNDHEPFTDEEWIISAARSSNAFLCTIASPIRVIAGNWCEALGTVLAMTSKEANPSGRLPCRGRKMRQCSWRITEYADACFKPRHARLSAAMKDMQRNWIGRSEGRW